MPNLIEYSIIIPVYNNADGFSHCLKALSVHRKKSIEIIAVDDCSSKKGLKEIACRFGCRYLLLHQHSGPGLARNKGVAVSKGRWLVFLDADVLVAEDFMEMIETRTKNLSPSACLQGVYNLATPAESPASQYKNLYYYFNYFHRINRQEYFYVSSHCFVMPKKMFTNIGGFNPKIKSVIEDADLCFRLLQKGYQVILDRTIRVTHLKRFNVASLVINDALLSGAKAKHILRNFGRDRGGKLVIISGGTLGQMYPVVLNVIVSPLIAVLILAFLVARTPWIAYTTVILAIIYAGINADFFRFIARRKGKKFLLRLVPVYYCDMVGAGIGVLWGTVDYIVLGRRY